MNKVSTAAFTAAVVLFGYILGEQRSVQANFVNEWAVEIPGGRYVVDDVANQHGYFVQDTISGLDDHYVLRRRDVPHRSRRSADHHTRKLVDDERVHFAEQQQAKIRVKRGGQTEDESQVNQRWSRDLAREIVRRDGKLDDPNFTHQWYLNPGNLEEKSAEVTDLRVRECWKKGLTGKNIVVTILDDGLEKNHTDLMDNYDPKASFDINNNDTDPQPRYDVTNENKHGTRCAGEVAMVANNNNCGVGIAFDSKVGGIRMLDGVVTDRTEAASLTFRRDYIDIYSASWGPNDDGKTTEQPGRLVRKALQEGVAKGRGGKGSIFAWASGNGGRVGDNCNSDGYTSSIYTLSVSSATQYGNSPWYAEKCSSTLATTYSSGAMSEKKVITSDLRNTCTEQHSGTSAAAPLAAGIFALLLEANPELTWRDVQHITVHSARRHPLRHEKGWYRNAAGYCVNLAFGFGLMDALAMVELADPSTWKSVGEQHICRVQDNDGLPSPFKSGESIEVELTTDGCNGQANEINFLEHLEIVLDLKYGRRGVIYAELESPSGTITSMMQERHYDTSKAGFVKFPLMSVHTWGENPNGTWKFRVADRSDGNYSGQLENVTLILYGTKDKPPYREDPVTNCEGVTETGDPTRTPTSQKTKPLIDVLSDTLNHLHGSSKQFQTQEAQDETSRIIEKLRELMPEKFRQQGPRTSFI